MTAWKDLERRVCVQLGGRRAGPQGAPVSDCVNVPFAVEVKRCKIAHVEGRWLQQARAQSKREHKPWLLVVANHHDRAPTVTLDWQNFLRIAILAGIVPRTEATMTLETPEPEPEPAPDDDTTDDE